MQVMGQRIKYGTPVVAASANQRHFTAEVDALLNDALSVALFRQFGGFVRAQTPLSAAVITADATLYNRQFAQHSEDIVPLAFIRQQLPRRGRQSELVEQLFLRQTVSNDWEHVAVHKSVMARQFTGQRGFRPAFNLSGNDALVERHGFGFGIQTDRPDGNTQWFTGLAQHAA